MPYGMEVSVGCRARKLALSAPIVPGSSETYWEVSKLSAVMFIAYGPLQHSGRLVVALFVMLRDARAAYMV